MLMLIWFDFLLYKWSPNSKENKDLFKNLVQIPNLKWEISFELNWGTVQREKLKTERSGFLERKNQDFSSSTYSLNTTCRGRRRMSIWRQKRRREGKRKERRASKGKATSVSGIWVGGWSVRVGGWWKNWTEQLKEKKKI